MAFCGTVSQVLHDFRISDSEGKVGGDYYWRFRERHYAGQKKRRMRRSAG